MQNLPTITIIAGQQASTQAYRTLHKPVSLYIRAIINRTSIAATTNKQGWNRLAGFVRCTFWQAIKARLGITPFLSVPGGQQVRISLSQPECSGVALMWRFVNDKLELAIDYTFKGESHRVPVNHKVQFDKPFTLKLRLPVFNKKHNWGYYLPPALHHFAKNKWTCKLRCTIGHQAKDPYGNRL